MKRFAIFGLFCSLLISCCITTNETGAVKEVEAGTYHPDMPGILVDPIQFDPIHKEIFQKIDNEVNEELKGVEKAIGFVHSFWYTKKKILKEKYGINWRSPSELNPNVNFD